MGLQKIVFVTAIAVLLVVVLGAVFLQQASVEEKAVESSVLSPYVGEDSRQIKAFSQEDITGLLAGAGTPFGGMAKPAELNGYPGPRHVLDAAMAGEFNLTNEQKTEIESLFEKMQSSAIEIGNQIIVVEKEIDDAFKSKTIDEKFLDEKISQSAKLYGELREAHLTAHLAMLSILTPEQVNQYNQLRGYESGDPCENVPEGHDPQMWRLHNNCP